MITYILRNKVGGYKEAETKPHRTNKESPQSNLNSNFCNRLFSFLDFKRIMENLSPNSKLLLGSNFAKNAHGQFPRQRSSPLPPSSPSPVSTGSVVAGAAAATVGLAPHQQQSQQLQQQWQQRAAGSISSPMHNGFTGIPGSGGKFTASANSVSSPLPLDLSVEGRWGSSPESKTPGFPAIFVWDDASQSMMLVSMDAPGADRVVPCGPPVDYLPLPPGQMKVTAIYKLQPR